MPTDYEKSVRAVPVGVGARDRTATVTEE